MYEVRRDDLLAVHDLHPECLSTAHALRLGIPRITAVQHHRAHVASVLAERGEWTKRVIGVSFDGTGYGDDGSIWGGEIFVGSVEDGFERVAHLRRAALAGGDAAAHDPVQAAAGFLAQIERLPDVLSAPFGFPARYRNAADLVRKNVRTFTTTSVGRLFDAAAALLGFTRKATFEGQAAMWIEQIARKAAPTEPYPFPLVGDELDFRSLLLAVMQDRIRGRGTAEIARSFQFGIARGLRDAVNVIAHSHELDTVVLSGGVFQNELLLEDLKSMFAEDSLQVWTNHAVPPNDGGISLGQAALAALSPLAVEHPGEQVNESNYA
jgi:hydrogenase maturation protein HypF